MGYVINFISGPSVGKSVISSLVYGELKCKGYTTEYVQEYAKQLVWLEKWDKLNNQYLVSSKQYELINVLNKVKSIKYIVVDGSLLLGAYYNKHYKTNVSNIEKTEEMILNRMKEFKNIYIYLERNPEIQYENEGRVQTYKESVQIDKRLLELLEEQEIKYKKYRSEKHNVAKIIEYIEQEMQTL